MGVVNCCGPHSSCVTGVAIQECFHSSSHSTAGYPQAYLNKRAKLGEAGGLPEYLRGNCLVCDDSAVVQPDGAEDREPRQLSRLLLGDSLPEELVSASTVRVPPAALVPRVRHGRGGCHPVIKENVDTDVQTDSTGTLVYIERVPTSKSSACEDGASIASCGASSTETHAKAICILKTAGIGMLAVSPGALDKIKLAEFRELLQKQGIDTSSWGVNGAKSVEHLFWEAYEQHGCVLTGAAQFGNLKRVTRLVKIRLVSDIYGVEHTLFSRMQFMHDGQYHQRKQLPLKKLTWSDLSEEDSKNCNEVFYAETCPYTQDWRVGARMALQERLGLSERWQEQHLHEDMISYSYHTEDNVKSDGYPGLNTLYCIHAITYRVVDPENAQVIGLPHGQEFATTEGDFNFNGQDNEDGLPIGTQLNIWMWARDTQPCKSPAPPREESLKPTPKAKEDGGLASRLINRVPLPLMSAQALHSMKTKISQKTNRAPSYALWSALDGKKTDWGRVQKIAKSILDPKYSLEQFNKDLSAFPELNLYLLDKDTQSHLSLDVTQISSGRTIGDEYQRTVGAFFAIYWMVRLGIDGKEGFCLGVDNKWKPNKVNGVTDKSVFQLEKRLHFLKNGRWDDFKRLLVDSGVLVETRRGIKVDEKRMTALLALTAIHDIMKLDLLLPEVQAAHAPYHGYAAGDKIADHDHALAYIMDHFPEMLPSFKDLDIEDRRSLQFTQCNLCFNHGWFVQAEAPPGAVFTQFRQCLIRDHRSQLGSRDIALYFVHWLTDLAGAEPTPLGGSEKFVVKFPLPVLNSFLRSFEVVGKLALKTESEVMEDYLKIRWAEHQPSAGLVPTGSSAVAKMRLLCMAQSNAIPVVKAFEELSDADKEVLSVEMARSGCVGQSYSLDIIPSEVAEQPGGPAFLIYYGPAFLQNLGTDPPVQRLALLAEIYRCAREVWQQGIAKVANTVTVRIDTIKALSISNMVEVANKGEVWLLVKHNENEAFVERSSKRKLNKFIANGQITQVLDVTAMESQYSRMLK